MASVRSSQELFSRLSSVDLLEDQNSLPPGSKLNELTHKLYLTKELKDTYYTNWKK